MAIFTMATSADYDERLDFANYVFSNNSSPHDFRAMLPKAYSRENANRVTSFLAKDEKSGRIIGMVDLLIQRLIVGEMSLSLGCIGTVSAYPYRRGEGLMSTLMNNAVRYCLDSGVDMMCLGGQRQRYGHFGFESGGTRLCFHINTKNVREITGYECIRFEKITDNNDERLGFFLLLHNKTPMHIERTKENFLLSAQSWDEELFAVYNDENLIGYLNGTINELVLENGELILQVITAFLNSKHHRSIEISIGEQDTERIKTLSTICENFSVSPSEKLKLLNKEKCIQTLLQFKNSYSPLCDGSFVLGYAGDNIEITVSDGNVKAHKADKEPMLNLGELEVQRLLLSPLSFVSHFQKPLDNWFPLPFLLYPADSF